MSTTHRPATDLGYLLHKHAGRAQRFDTAGGAAHVFYPQATDERCTAALFCDIDHHLAKPAPDLPITDIPNQNPGGPPA